MQGQLRVRILGDNCLCFNIFCYCCPTTVHWVPSCLFRHDCYHMLSSNSYPCYCFIRSNTQISLLLNLLLLPLFTLAHTNGLSFLDMFMLTLWGFLEKSLTKIKFNIFYSINWGTFYFTFFYEPHFLLV